MDNEKLGSFIKTLRQEKGWTQKELADRVHVTDKAVSKWERGLSAPSIDLLSPLAQVFDISVLELLDGQRQENELIDFQTANAILEDTVQRQRKSIRKNRILFALLTVFICICLRISGQLMWNQGILLDEQNLSPASLYLYPDDLMLDWARFGLLFLMLPPALIAAIKRE